MCPRLFPALTALLLWWLLAAPAQAEPLRIYAAASLTNALTDVAAHWERQGREAPTLVFAGSSALARQIEAGAPADLFASADLKWMDYLDERKKIQADSRGNLLGNRLVLIVPKGRRLPVEVRAGFDIAAAFEGKLCTGEPSVVPVGIYAKQALESLGWWAPLQRRIVGTDDVRAALAFVERGECSLGIVYATDAAISSKVEVIATFPETTHQPIVYPFAIVAGGSADARAFLDFLHTSPDAIATFERYGFSLPR